MALEYGLELWLGCGCVYVLWLWNTGSFEKYWVYPGATWVRICLKLCYLLSPALLLRPLVFILVSHQVSYCSLSLGTSPITETVIWFLDLRMGVALTKWVQGADNIYNKLAVGLHCCGQLLGEKDGMLRRIWKSVLLSSFQDGSVTVTYKSSV